MRVEARGKAVLAAREPELRDRKIKGPPRGRSGPSELNREISVRGGCRRVNHRRRYSAILHRHRRRVSLRRRHHHRYS